ncbi:MAG TPA: glycosyltransferase family A protein [Victivallales bacterium]|nr:glycosyltransferase family A protein [Victivallales bacterium]
MKKTRPKVSVCIPVYNNTTYIQETVRSILNQTYKDFEIIIIDDGSPDESTWELVSAFQEPVKAFKQKNQGIAGAKNACVEKASGEYIAFCDHDDLWEPDKLEKQVKILDENGEIGFVFTGFTRFNKKEGEIKTLSQKIDSRDVFASLLKKSYIYTSTLLIRRSLWNKAGGYNTTFTLADDLEFHLRLAYNAKPYCLSEPLMLYRLHTSNTSRSSASKAKYPYELERIYTYWLSVENLTAAQRKCLKKRLGKCYFDMAKLAIEKSDKPKYMKLLKKAVKEDRLNRRYLLRFLRAFLGLS